MQGSVGPQLQVVVGAGDADDVREPAACPSDVVLGVASSEARLLTAVSDDLENHLQEGDEPSSGHAGPWRRICVKIVATIAIFLIVSCCIERFAEKPVARFSKELMRRIGWPGLFFGVLVLDGVPQPFTYVPLIFMAVKGSASKLQVFMICATASYLAAILGYLVGGCLHRPLWGKRYFDRVSQGFPYVPALMQRKGARGVLLAAMLPVPLAVATWMAGFFGVPFSSFMLAAFGRFPKILLFVLLSGGPGPHSA